MLTEVQQFYGLVKEFQRAGYYETEHLRRLFKEISSAINYGSNINLVAINPGRKISLLLVRGFLIAGRYR